MDDAIFEDRFTEVGSVKSRYWSAGETGSVVILLHGLGCSVEYWERNIAALAQKRRVFAVDIVGFGRTDRSDQVCTIELMADFVVDFMNTLGIDKASLVGNSMGGSVALGVAAHAPERVEKIVLADPVGFGRKVSPMMRMMTLPVFGSVLTKPGRQGVVRQMQLCLHDPSQASEDFIDRVTAIGTLPGSQYSFLSFLRDTTDIFGLKKSFVMDFSTRLKKVKTPTLVIWGRQDRLLPISEAKAALKNMKDIRLYVMDRAGHLPQIDNPEEFNTAVLDFLSTATRK